MFIGHDKYVMERVILLYVNSKSIVVMPKILTVTIGAFLEMV